MTLLLAAVLIFGGNISDPALTLSGAAEPGAMRPVPERREQLVSVEWPSKSLSAASHPERSVGRRGAETAGSAAPLSAISDPAWAIKGDANFAETSHGSNYLAMRLPRGTRVTICAVHCATMTVSDYGPAKRTGDIADIALVRFARICGYTIPQARRRGECEVVVTGAASLPQTDTTSTSPSLSSTWWWGEAV